MIEFELKDADRVRLVRTGVTVYISLYDTTEKFVARQPWKASSNEKNPPFNTKCYIRNTPVAYRVIIPNLY